MGIKYRILQNKNGKYFFQRKSLIFWMTPHQGEFDTVDMVKLLIKDDRYDVIAEMQYKDRRKIKKIVEIIE